MRNEDPHGLLARLTHVRRARGFRLYLADGRRIVDLWQCGGAAILGHTPTGMLGALKDTASRGLFAAFPGPLTRRLERLLSSLVPGFPAVRVYVDESQAESALRRAGFAVTRLEDFADPVFSLPEGGVPAWWRPWSPVAVGSRILAPVLPVPLPASARPIVFLMNEETAAAFPRSSPVSPLFLALAVRAVASLVTALPQRTALPAGLLTVARKALGANALRGPYLRFPEATDPAAYAALFDRFLLRGFLLPPDPRSPAIIPADMSAGEAAALSVLLSESGPKTV
jgi:hypothetical protein